jgi:hypothetical protein
VWVRIGAMGTDSDGGRFSRHDLDDLSAFVIDAWATGRDADWSLPAGTLEWSCWHTADHLVDCVFSYALFLGSRRQDTYPPFGEVHASEDATPADLIDGLRAVTAILSALIAATPADARSIIWRRPTVGLGTPDDFAARGGLEMILHAHDVCGGLGVAFEPPAELCRRLYAATDGWPGNLTVEPTDDAWHDLLVRSGRPSPRS